MPKFLVNTPQGTQEILELGPGGSYFDRSRIVWCWDKDGEPPVKLDLGFMERIVKIEPIKDKNGKQVYDIILEGEHKTDRVKVPAEQRVVYLLNKKLGKRVKSNRPPKRLTRQG